MRTPADRNAEDAARFRAVVSAGAIGVAVGVGDVVTEANAELRRLLGRTPEEVAEGLTWSAITAPDQLERDTAVLRDVRRSGHALLVRDLLRADGTRVPVLAALVLHTNGLVARRGEDLDAGVVRLAAAVGDRAGDGAGDPRRPGARPLSGRSGPRRRRVRPRGDPAPRVTGAPSAVRRGNPWPEVTASWQRAGGRHGCGAGRE